MANLQELLLQLDTLSADLRSSAIQSGDRDEVPQGTTEQLQNIITKLQGIKGAVEGTKLDYVQAYRAFLAGAVTNFVNCSEELGGEVKEQAALFKKAFDAQETFLEVAMQSKAPQESVLDQLMEPTMQAVAEVQQFCQNHRLSAVVNHLYAVSDGSPALKWISTDTTPAQHIQSYKEASEVYTNIILESFKGEETVQHVEWVHALLKVFNDLSTYVENYHSSSLLWNVQNKNPVVPVAMHSANGEGPFLIPPEVLAVLTGASTAQSDTDIIVLTAPDAQGEAGTVLAQINQGLEGAKVPPQNLDPGKEDEPARSSKSKKKKSKKSKKSKKRRRSSDDDSSSKPDDESSPSRRGRRRKNNDLKCEHCDRVMSTATSLKNHIRSFHTGERPHKCDLCDKSYVTISRLRDHKMTHTGDRPHQCETCGKGFRTAYRLRKHAVVHTEERTHQCSLCPKMFKSIETRKIHEGRHTSLRTFQCQDCGKSYKTNHDMKRHALLHHANPEDQNKVHQCTTCGKQFRTAPSLKAHERTHQQHTKYQCTYCTTVFSSIRSLKTHEDVQHLGGAGKFQCSICGKVCSYRGGLTLHEKTHLGERPYECSQCDKKFSRAYGLKRHYSIAHLNERPYQCGYCPKRYNTDCEKRYHERTHTGDRPYQCNFCEKAYMMASHLSTHMRTHKDIIQIINVTEETIHDLQSAQQIHIQADITCTDSVIQ